MKLEMMISARGCSRKQLWEYCSYIEAAERMAEEALVK